MKSILIGGYYGAGNLGDEAILEAILRDFQQLGPEFEITVLSWQPELTRQLHQVRAISWQAISRIAEEVSRMDLVLIGGGGIFQDYWGLDPDSYLRINHGGITSYGSLARLAEIFGVPCLFYGVGAGPLRTEQGRQAAREAVQASQGILVRDQESSQELLDCGFDPADPGAPSLSIGTDLSFKVPPRAEAAAAARKLLSERGIPRGTRLLGINLRYWNRPEPPDSWLPLLAAGIRNFLASQPDLQVVLFPFQNYSESIFTNDDRVCKDFYHQLDLPERSQLISQVVDPELMKALIGECSLFSGMRYHAVIFALLQGVPPLALSYDPKVERLMGSAGLKAVLPLEELDDPDKLAGLLHSLAADREGVITRMERFLAEQARLAAGDLDFLSAALAGPPLKPDQKILQQEILERIKLMEKLDIKLAAQEERMEELEREKHFLERAHQEVNREVDLLASSRSFQLFLRLRRIRRWFRSSRGKPPRADFWTRRTAGKGDPP